MKRVIEGAESLDGRVVQFGWKQMIDPLKLLGMKRSLQVGLRLETIKSFKLQHKWKPWSDELMSF